MRALLSVLVTGVALAAGAMWLADLPAPQVTPATGPEAGGAVPQPPREAGGRLSGSMAAPAGEAAGGALYGWRDAGGTVHISSSPPAGNVEPDWVRSFDRPAAGPGRGAAPAADAADAAAADDARLAPFGVYSPQGLRELRERAGEVAEELDDRRRLMDRLADDL